MSDPKSRLSTRVQVFTRATADASNRAIGEVFDARSPWQLLYRLRRIVFLGLVLYLGWILVVVQPDLARRLMLPPTPRFQERFALHRDPVEEVLQAAVAAPGFGLHALFVAEWDGAGSLQVLAAEGRTPQLPLEPGDARCQLRRRRAYLIVAEHWRRRPAAGRGDGPGDGPCRPGPLRR